MVQMNCTTQVLIFAAFCTIFVFGLASVILWEKVNQDNEFDVTILATLTSIVCIISMCYLISFCYRPQTIIENREAAELSGYQTLSLNHSSEPSESKPSLPI